MVMTAQCLIVNCNRKAPDDEAFCAKHRKDNATIAANLEAAQTVIAEQLEIRQRLEEERATHLEAITNLGAIIARLRKRAITHVCQPDDQVMVDAARYRWLRDHSCPPHNFYISVPDEFSGVHYTPAEVDDYIDAAIAKQESPHDNRR